MFSPIIFHSLTTAACCTSGCVDARVLVDPPWPRSRRRRRGGSATWYGAGPRASRCAAQNCARGCCSSLVSRPTGSAAPDLCVLARFAFNTAARSPRLAVVAVHRHLRPRLRHLPQAHRPQQDLLLPRTGAANLFLSPPWVISHHLRSSAHSSSGTRSPRVRGFPGPGSNRTRKAKPRARTITSR